MGSYDPTIPQALLTRAERGEPTAQYLLGLFYATEDTGAEGLIQAHMWFNIAAVSGDDRARSERQEIADMMSAAEVAEAQKRARAQLQLQRG
ncbi:MAG: hypothetical protein P1U65_15250 [Minwuia sp.]|nr:hypothetical protein [Minwuia sp.]